MVVGSNPATPTNTFRMASSIPTGPFCFENSETNVLALVCRTARFRSGAIMTSGTNQAGNRGGSEASSRDSFFDLADAEGVTESERFLAGLCRRSFLRLWAFPNAFSNEGVRETGPSSGKEFVDVLAVFGDDVILFSDKHISFHEEIDVSVAWPRWYKSAVVKSVRQLLGALNWVRRFPESIFLDAACSRPLPIRLPPTDRARFHLVATTRGSQQAAVRWFRGGLGTHAVDTSVQGSNHLTTPFTIGNVEPSKHFVHVLDEASLEYVMREMDTARDLIDYLVARERFLTSGAHIVAPGEEQLLALYIRNMRDNSHWFLGEGEDIQQGQLLAVDSSPFSDLLSRPEYVAKKQADAPSYLWDSLIERFISEGDTALLGATTSSSDVERALRIIASESRFDRRNLVAALRGLFDVARGSPDARRVRLYATRERPNMAYVLLVDPKDPNNTYDEYRRRRAEFLQLYCRCARLRIPEATTFVGLGFDHPAKTYAGGSEDLAIFVWRDGEVPDMVELRRMADDVGILPETLAFQHAHELEFPQGRKQLPETNTKPLGGKKKKKRSNMAKASRRKNRKK